MPGPGQWLSLFNCRLISFDSSIMRRNTFLFRIRVMSTGSPTEARYDVLRSTKPKLPALSAETTQGKCPGS